MNNIHNRIPQNEAERLEEEEQCSSTGSSLSELWVAPL